MTTFADLLRNVPPPKSDLTSALDAIRALREVAIHRPTDEWRRLEEAIDNLEEFVYRHASDDEFKQHLENRHKEGLDKPHWTMYFR